MPQTDGKIEGLTAAGLVAKIADFADFHPIENSAVLVEGKTVTYVTVVDDHICLVLEGEDIAKA